MVLCPFLKWIQDFKLPNFNKNTRSVHPPRTTFTFPLGTIAAVSAQRLTSIFHIILSDVGSIHVKVLHKSNKGIFHWVSCLTDRYEFTEQPKLA